MRWHQRGIYLATEKSYLVGEQFWGRAVRASRNSKEFGTLLIWSRYLLRRRVGFLCALCGCSPRPLRFSVFHLPAFCDTTAHLYIRNAIVF
jgi:hypothetical protein